MQVVSAKVDDSERLTIDAAAAMTGRSRSGFVREAAMEAARRTIRQEREKGRSARGSSSPETAGVRSNGDQN